jgi:adenylate cyclase
MNEAWQIRVYERQIPVYQAELTGTVELGRQSDGEEKPYFHYKREGRWRMVIARLDEDTVSRKHVLLEPLGPNRIRITNVSAKLPIRLLPEDREIKPNTSAEAPLSAMLTVGKRTVRIHAAGAPPGGMPLQMQVLPDVTTPPGQPSILSTRVPTLALSIDKAPDQEEFRQALKALARVLNDCATSSEFFQPAANALVQMIEMDSGRVLLLENDEWQVKAMALRGGMVADPEWQPSKQVLNYMEQVKRSVYQVPSSASEAVSLAGVKAVAAAPILDRNSTVIGAVYGDRRLEGSSLTIRPISPIEATLVDLLAQAVATGMARMREESARVQLEQFFTKDLATQLVNRRDLLQGHDAEVTVLFCDVRGFSRISASLGTAKTVEWINDVMSELSECVLKYQGVLVDYIGDALMAMWGAPEPQPDQARRACQAALDMLGTIPKLNERWGESLPEPMYLTIGTNTGQARVGNVGSRRKFKYGPLGDTVNVASRIQGATKFLQSPLLMTRKTYDQLGGDFLGRRVCWVRLINITDPVELFEVQVPGHPISPDWKAGYEQALAEFEEHRFRQAARCLGPLVAEQFNDGTALVLMSRAVNALVHGPEPNHPIWELPGK